MAKKIGKEFLVFSFLAIAIFHALALKNTWYWIFPSLDIPMHLLGGAWLALVFFFVLDSTNIRIARGGKDAPFISALCAVGFVMLFAVMWEFAEFAYDIFLSQKDYLTVMQRGTGDTMKDLFMSLLGGSLAAAINTLFGIFSTPARN